MMLLGMMLFIVRTVWVYFGPVWVIAPIAIACFFIFVPKWHAERGGNSKHGDEGKRYMELGALRKAEVEFMNAAASAIRPITKAQILVQLGECQRRQKKFMEAEESVREGMTALEKAKKTVTVPYAACLEKLGNIERDRENLSEAIQLFRQSLDVLSNVKDVDPREVASKQCALAISESEAGDRANFIPDLERALQACEESLGDESPECSALVVALGAAYTHGHAYSQAIPVLERAVVAQRILYGHNDMRSAESLYQLGIACQRTGEIEKATTNFEHLLKLHESHLGSDPRDTAYVYMRLAEVYADGGRPTLAADFARRTITLLESNGHGGEQLAEAFDRLAQLWDDAGQAASAVQYRDKATAVREAAMTPSSGS